MIDISGPPCKIPKWCVCMWSWNGDKAPAKPLVKAAKSSNLSALPHQTCSRSQLPFDYSWKLKSIHVHFFKAFDLMWRCKKTVHQQQIILRNTSSGGMTMESHFSNWQKICFNKNFWQMWRFGVEIKSLMLTGKTKKGDFSIWKVNCFMGLEQLNYLSQILVENCTSSRFCFPERRLACWRKCLLWGSSCFPGH